MNANQNGRAYGETFLTAVLMVFTTFGSQYTLICSILMFFIPAFLMVLSGKYGTKYGIIAVVIAAAGMSILMSPVTGLLLIMVYASSGLVMGWMGQKVGKNPYFRPMAGTLATIVGITVMFALLQAATGVSISGNLDKIMETAGKVTPEMTQMMTAGGVDAEMVKTAMEQMVSMIRMLLPSLILMWSLVFAYINCRIADRVLVRRGVFVDRLPALRYFTLPRNILIGALLIMGLCYLTGYLGIIDQKVMLANVQSVFLFLFSIQGLAVVLTYGSVKPKQRFLAVLVIVVCIVTTIGRDFLFLLGMMDVIFVFRAKIYEKKA